MTPPFFLDFREFRTVTEGEVRRIWRVNCDLDLPFLGLRVTARASLNAVTTLAQ
jgi:hypothetical protein